MSKDFHPDAIRAVASATLAANSRVSLPKVKPEKKQVTFEYLYQQQQTLATMSNFIRMALLCVAELDHKFVNPVNNQRMQSCIDNLYSIINSIQSHPQYKFKPKSEDLAEDVAGETYELNKLLMHLEVDGIIAMSDSIRAALAEDQRLAADSEDDKIN